MDAGHKSDRLYPAYTTAELKMLLRSDNIRPMDAATRAKMQGEVDRRDADTSVAFVVPQIGRPA